MKRLTLRLATPALAAALLLGVTAGPARAYFTASDVANGGVVISIPTPHTKIREEYGDGLKQVTIFNEDDSAPVWVRAKAFIPKDMLEEGEATVSGEGWTAIGDGWFMYDQYLNPGEKTETTLDIKWDWRKIFTSEDVSDDGVIATTVTGTTTGTDQGGEDGGTSTVTIIKNKADGTNYSIVVVYECTLVKFGEDGETPVTPVIWTENN